MLVPSSAFAQSSGNGVTDTTNLDHPSHLTWSAGPGSQVSTGTGVLQTSIPLFALKAPGRTSMSFGLYHRSNQAAATYAGPAQGYAGLAWQPSSIQYVNAGTQGNYLVDAQEMQGENAAHHWHVATYGGGIPNYVRRPGCRADLTAITAGNTLNGFLVVDQASSVKYYYQHHDTYQVSHWLLSSVVDPRGNTVSYAYDGFHRVTQITDAAGRCANLTWPAAQFGQLQSVALTTSAGTRTWYLQYWASTGHGERLQNVVYPQDNAGNRPSVHFEYYNSDDNIADIVDARGADWHYVYSGVGPNGLGETVSAVYEPSVTPPSNYSYASPFTSTYDHNNPLLFYFCPNTSGGSSDQSTTVNGQTITLPKFSFTGVVFDRLGRMTRHQYDYGVNADSYGPGAYVINNEWMGSPIQKVIDPDTYGADGSTVATYAESFSWDYSQGTLTSHTDRRGNVTTFNYDTSPRDNSGMVNSMTRNVKNVSKTWSYVNWYLTGSQPRQVVTKDPDMRRTVTGMDWTYDEPLYRVVDPQTDPNDGSYSKPGGVAIKTSFTHNSVGELTDEWTGSDPHTVTGYDAYGNATSVTDPAGNAHTATYDAWNRRLSSSPGAPEGTTSFQYDNLDRLVETDLPDGHKTLQTYDLNGNATIATKEDGVTNVTTLYDGLSRPTQVTQPVDSTPSHNLVTLFGYDLLGQRTGVTSPRGLTTAYGFDERGKNVLVTLPDSTTRKTTYDGDGNKASFTNGRNQRTAYAYDELDRLVGIDYPSSADVSYTYRIDGPRLSMADGTGTSTYAYDDAGRLTGQTQGLTGKTLTTHYVPGTNRRQSLGDGTQTWTTGYDAGLRPSTLAQTVGSASPVTATSYYPSGAVQSESFGNATQTTYTLDGRGRATRIAHATTGGAALQTLTHHYTTDGNLDTTVDVVEGSWAWTTGYAHDGADRLLSEVRTGGPSGNYSTQYGYDPNGNRTSVVRDGAASYYGTAGLNDRFEYGDGYSTGDYDADGNVGSFYLPGGSVWGLYYDENSRLLGIYAGLSATFRYDGDGRRVERAMGGTTTRFVYDGDRAVEETNGSNVVTLYRTPGVGFVRNGAQRYEQDERLGSVLAVRDQSGALTGQSEYDAYGREVWTGANSDRGSQRFVGAKGYQNDDASGMQLLGERYYLPALGRFLTQDPIGQAGGLNLYAYCDDGPLMRTDPSGRQSVLGYDFHLTAEGTQSAWNSLVNWWSGRDTVDRRGHPVRVGGFVQQAMLNHHNNIMTINGTMHAYDEATFRNFMADYHWQLHEEGHIKQGFAWYDVPLYFLGAQAVGFVQEYITAVGGPSIHGRTGHDYNVFETYAEDYARSVDGRWDFGSPPSSSIFSSHLENFLPGLPWRVR